MGAWNFLSGKFYDLISTDQRLICVSRPASASPANGSTKISNQQQENLIKEAFQ
jgi:2-oxoglutarate dehydrogenase E1 component